MTTVITFMERLLVLAVIAALAVWYLSNAFRVEGSVQFGNEYQATSTAPSLIYGAQTKTTQLLKTGGGGLGSVNIMGANSGTMNFYDATTTNVNKRTGQAATSSILLVSIPASAPAKTYTFDLEFNTGLLYDLIDGTMPTTTITWR